MQASAAPDIKPEDDHNVNSSTAANAANFLKDGQANESSSSDNLSIRSNLNLGNISSTAIMLETQYNKMLSCECQNNDCCATSNRSAFISSMDFDYGPSSCGAFSVWAVLSMLGVDNIDRHRLPQVIGIRKRADTAPLPAYLLSRANAGCTALELMTAVFTLTHQNVGGRFFATWPSRKLALHRWLGFWLRHGAVPVLTLNLQKYPNTDPALIADAWHHDVVFAVSHGRGSNPLVHTISHPSGLKENVVAHQLDSDSVLLVRRSDVVSRYQPSMAATGNSGESSLKDPNDLRHLCNVAPEWDTANVLGQVVNIMREETFRHLGSLAVGDPYVTSHLKIPASYQAGVTLFAWRNSPIMDFLQSVPDLPEK